MTRDEALALPVVSPAIGATTMVFLADYDDRFIDDDGGEWLTGWVDGQHVRCLMDRL